MSPGPAGARRTVAPSPDGDGLAPPLLITLTAVTDLVAAVSRVPSRGTP
jgi:hypothetical protein